MTENVRKVFDLLGVEPGDKFILEESTSNAINTKAIYTIDEDLIISDDRKYICQFLLDYLLRGDYKIIKLPKEPNKIKKKLRDLTIEEYKKWERKNCKICFACDKCIFKNVVCSEAYSKSWINHKDLYSDKFLDQEIEVEE